MTVFWLGWMVWFVWASGLHFGQENYWRSAASFLGAGLCFLGLGALKSTRNRRG